MNDFLERELTLVVTKKQDNDIVRRFMLINIKCNAHWPISHRHSASVDQCCSPMGEENLNQHWENFIRTDESFFFGHGLRY